jgi:hypothetical protein
MADQCPTCGSNRREWDRSPTSSRYNWHQYRRNLASFTCPDEWHTRPTQETDPE